MRAVSNTSPISNLASIGRLSLVESQFSRLRIPSAVYRELSAHPDAAAIKAIEDGIRRGWIEIEAVERTPLVGLLRSRLDAGEAEAIALAITDQCDFLLMDEQEGREAARLCGLRVTGVLGILLRSKLSGAITAIRPEIDALRAKSGFFISRELEKKILREAGE